MVTDTSIGIYVPLSQRTSVTTAEANPPNTILVSDYSP